MDIYILKYNNYYNRMAKYRFDNVSQYPAIPIHILRDCKDFTPNDGVNTQHLFGSVATNYDGSGDYLLVTEETGDVLSRWFILETKFTRQGQWVLTLHRDLIADYRTEIVNADCFIEKAILPANSNLIFNKENMTVNQIKTSETPLKDETNSAWIVGYYTLQDSDTETSTTLTASIPQSTDNYDVAITETFESWKTSNGFKNSYTYTNSTNLELEVILTSTAVNTNQGIIQDCYKYFLSQTDQSKEQIIPAINSGLIYTLFNEPSEQAMKDALINTNILNQMAQVLGLDAWGSINNFYQYKNQILRFPDGSGNYIYKKIRISETYSQSLLEVPITSGTTPKLFGDLKNAVAPLVVNTEAADRNPNAFKATTTTYPIIYSVMFEDVVGPQLTVSIVEGKNKLEDAGYSMFAIPYNDVSITYNGTVINQNGSDGLRIASALAKKYYGGKFLFDLQLLPYCPLRQIIKADGSLATDGLTNGAITEIKSGDTTVGLMFHPSKSSFSFDITDITIPITNTKLQNECDMHRLCSPNYNGIFEFNAARNGGVRLFNVDCTYKPYSPYIHINPNFGKLYGRDFDDARGLICGGDFSLPIMTDSFATYELQNKNYEKTFQRQIENMEVQHSAARNQEIASAIAGSAQGAVGGALAGSLIPGVGTIAGALVGGAASVAGGIADIAINDMLRNEAMDYTKDLHGFQLGNIKALPNGLAKVSAFTANNKIFPILEYYTCTDEEKKAVANKIAWNSMTVGVIGKIKDFYINVWSYTTNNETIISKGYIKGNILRIDSIQDEYHLLKAINEEIYKGVYF